MKKLVTVVIHSFNRFEYLTNAINSVLSQSMDDLEIILIVKKDDESVRLGNFDFSSRTTISSCG